MVKKVALVIAPEGFRDEEYLMPKKVLEDNNISVTTVSTQLGNARGKLGHMCGIDMTLKEVSPDNFDALVFVGGPGTPIVRSNPYTNKLVLGFFDKGKVVGAICWAVTILVNAGILKGKKATLWVGHDPEMKMTTKQYLEINGGIYVQKGVVVDGNIITADGPSSAFEFGKAIAELVTRKTR